MEVKDYCVLIGKGEMKKTIHMFIVEYSDYETFQEQLHILRRSHRRQLPPCRHRCWCPSFPYWDHHLLHAQGEAMC